MEDKNLETVRNLRIKSICSHLENKKTEIVSKVGLFLQRNPKPSNLLSRPAMNFLLGNRYVSFMDGANHLKMSVEVGKYIKKNNLLPNIDKELTAKYPKQPMIRRLILALNVSFSEGRAVPVNTPYSCLTKHRENERERE